MKNIDRHPFAVTEKQRFVVTLTVLVLLVVSFFADSVNLSWFAIGALVGSILSHNALLNPFTLWNLWRNRAHHDPETEVEVRRAGRFVVEFAGEADLVAKALQRELRRLKAKQLR